MAGSNIVQFPRGLERSAPECLYVEPRWYACYTRARSEKQVARLLSERRIESYLPLLPRLSQWTDRRKLVEFPMFPNYVFVRFTLRDMHAVLMTPGVSTIVRVNGYPAPFPMRNWPACVALWNSLHAPAEWPRSGHSLPKANASGFEKVRSREPKAT